MTILTQMLYVKCQNILSKILHNLRDGRLFITKTKRFNFFVSFERYEFLVHKIAHLELDIEMYDVLFLVSPF